QASPAPHDRGLRSPSVAQIVADRDAARQEVTLIQKALDAVNAENDALRQAQQPADIAAEQASAAHAPERLPPTVTVGGRPFTILFPDLVRPLTAQERQKLRDDIRQRGVVQPLIVDDADGIIDGGNRAQIAADLGLESVPVSVRAGLTPKEKAALA